jgi:hypothetical protein
MRKFQQFIKKRKAKINKNSAKIENKNLTFHNSKTLQPAKSGNIKKIQDNKNISDGPNNSQEMNVPIEISFCAKLKHWMGLFIIFIICVFGIFLVIEYKSNQWIEESLNKGMNNLCNIETVKSPIFRFFICPNYEFLYIEIVPSKDSNSLISISDQTESTRNTITSLTTENRQIPIQYSKIITRKRIKKKLKKRNKITKKENLLLGELSVIDYFNEKHNVIRYEELLFNDKVKLGMLRTEKNKHNQSFQMNGSLHSIDYENSNSNMSNRNYTKLYVNHETVERENNEKFGEEMHTIDNEYNSLKILEELNKSNHQMQNSTKSKKLILNDSDLKQLDINKHLKIIDKENQSINSKINQNSNNQLKYVI